jgi:hypothetical protein
VCDAARKRIYSGASMAAFDTDGWVAELWLASTKPLDPLDELVAGGKVTAKADEEISALADGQAEIAPGFSAAEQARFNGWHGATVRFSGRYVGAFLDPALRPRFLAMSDRMASAASAELGALWGRCAHLEHHDIGVWYRGADAPSVAAALVYGAGLFSELPAVDRRALAALGGASPLHALRDAGAKLDSAALGDLVGPHGGSVTAGPAGVITVAFPLGGPTRATRASRTVAAKLGIGIEGE